MVTGALPAGVDGLSHLAFLYHGADEYMNHMLAFVRAGLARTEPVFVALPGGLGSRVRAAAGGAAGQQLAVADMNELGRNPARITLALGTFANQHAGQRIRIVTEPLWPGRTDAETAEVMKHEALVQLAVGPVDAEILCPYNTAELGPALIADACHAHPEVFERGRRRPSSGYRPGAGVPPEAELPPPSAAAEFIAYRTHLSPARALVDRFAEAAGLPTDRRADLVLAVSELAANTLAHTAGGGTAHIWVSGHEIICQVHDGGWITDPMAGRRRPPPDSDGQGLWVVNDICDLVETRSGPAGTTTRLHFRLPGG
ncbi:MAG TPA: sensor histidine kinase [Streptosporangiaceae bacterium]|nr:sensor histidine kinase [Streptosporangiaceae bacterium]